MGENLHAALLWRPAHVGLQEPADRNAKIQSKKENIDVTSSKADFRGLIKETVTAKAVVGG